jgi:hypothetical protein
MTPAEATVITAGVTGLVGIAGIVGSSLAPAWRDRIQYERNAAERAQVATRLVAGELATIAIGLRIMLHAGRYPDRPGWASQYFPSDAWTDQKQTLAAYLPDDLWIRILEVYLALDPYRVLHTDNSRLGESIGDARESLGSIESESRALAEALGLQVASPALRASGAQPGTAGADDPSAR